MDHFLFAFQFGTPPACPDRDLNPVCDWLMQATDVGTGVKQWMNEWERMRDSSSQNEVKEGQKELRSSCDLILIGIVLIIRVPFLEASCSSPDLETRTHFLSWSPLHWPGMLNLISKRPEWRRVTGGLTGRVCVAKTMVTQLTKPERLRGYQPCA